MTSKISCFDHAVFQRALKKTAHYYGIILIFAIGAGIGGVCSLHIGIRAIWASSVLLAIVCTMMVREHR